jgi:hypothetical protein
MTTAIIESALDDAAGKEGTSESFALNTAPTPKKVGVLIGDLRADVTALKYLILYLNRLQPFFEYELLPFDTNAELLKRLSARGQADRSVVDPLISNFYRSYCDLLAGETAKYKLRFCPPEAFVVLTKCSFSDGYYGTWDGRTFVVALGSWQTEMAPPSFVEFMLTLVIRGTLQVTCKRFNSQHFGTKGCLFDFNANIEDTRFKVLHAFICHDCRKHLAETPGLADKMVEIQDSRWFGKSDDPSSPAGIAYNLGYDLFRNKGLKPTGWDKIKKLLSEEGPKEAVKWVFAVILTATLILLNLNLKK